MNGPYDSELFDLQRQIINTRDSNELCALRQEYTQLSGVNDDYINRQRRYAEDDDYLSEAEFEYLKDHGMLVESHSYEVCEYTEPQHHSVFDDFIDL